MRTARACLCTISSKQLSAYHLCTAIKRVEEPIDAARLAVAAGQLLAHYYLVSCGESQYVVDGLEALV